jgi:hypothetical protein
MIAQTPTEKYRNIKNFISLVLSPKGKELFEGKEWVISDALKLSTVVDKIYADYKVKNDPNLEAERKELKDFQDFKKTLDPSDLEIIQQANQQINTLLDEVTNKASYDPVVYFETYFHQVSLSEKTMTVGGASKTHNFTSFKDWFAGSVVVDAEDNPLIVYHGRYNEEVTRFSFDKFPAKYFAENLSYAQWFQKAKNTEGTIYLCYLRILNPLDLTAFGVEPVRYDDFVSYVKIKYGYDLPENKILRARASRDPKGMWTWEYLRFGVAWLKYIIKQGKFDGIHFYENNPNDKTNGLENTTPAWMVFKGTQIKSAQANILNNNNSTDIRFKKGGNL